MGNISLSQHLYKKINESERLDEFVGVLLAGTLLCSAFACFVNNTGVSEITKAYAERIRENTKAKLDRKNSKKENTVIENEVTENSNSAVSHMDLTQCYDIVHHMANTIIIADDGQIWGQNEITREAVTQMVNELKGQDDYLSDELKKWLELDFSNGVEVHNYVWNKLGGNVGKAKALNEEKVEQVIKVMTE